MVLLCRICAFEAFSDEVVSSVNQSDVKEKGASE